jgi:hypothetical protein
MTEIARRVVGQTTRNFPIILVGIGLFTTLMWVGTLVTVAVEQTWRVLSAI